MREQFGLFREILLGGGGIKKKKERKEQREGESPLNVTLVTPLVPSSRCEVTLLGNTLSTKSHISKPYAWQCSKLVRGLGQAPL